MIFKSCSCRNCKAKKANVNKNTQKRVKLYLAKKTRNYLKREILEEPIYKLKKIKFIYHWS